MTTIPTTVAELEELLADDAKRTAIFASADTTAEFIKNYTAATNKTGDLSRQISEQVQAGLTGFLKDAGLTSDRPDHDVASDILNRLPKANAADRGQLHNPNAAGAKLDGVFNSFGEMAIGAYQSRAGASGRMPAELAAKWSKADSVWNDYSSTDPASAGFLIPEEMRSDILSLALEQSIVRPRATVITMGSLTQSIPFVDVTTHVGSVFGGMVFYWTPESGEILTSEAKFGRVKFEANKLTGGAAVPNELFADAPSLNSWLNFAIPQGLAFYEDDAFLNGSGAGQPLGARLSPAMINVTRAVADEVNTADIFGIYARMLPQSLSRAVWVINQTVLPQLLGLTIDVGTGGSHVGLIQMGSVAGSPVMTMLGRPIVVTEKVPALGTAGDIGFIDFNYYLIGDRQSMTIESSTHSRFMNDETQLKVVERVDGRPWIQSALTPKNGDTLSPYVQLGLPA
jgi:HK97 family phage major capsid protein